MNANDTREGVTTKVEITSATTGEVQEGYITANEVDGKLFEVFLTGFGKAGSTLEGWVQLSAVLLSLAIQSGAELSELVSMIEDMKFDPYGMTNHPDIPECSSVPDLVMKWLALKFG